jgi:quercetin dioxygenase-like cupin family protein
VKVHDWSRVPREQLNNLVARQMVHTDSMTIARLYLAKGAFVPTHQHVNEQFSFVVQGTLRFHLNGEDVIVTAGQALQIPSNVPHSAEALEDSEALDLFSPVRQDWVSGDDAYLRSAPTTR